MTLPKPTTSPSGSPEKRSGEFLGLEGGSYTPPIKKTKSKQKVSKRSTFALDPQESSGDDIFSELQAARRKRLILAGGGGVTVLAAVVGLAVVFNPLGVGEPQEGGPAPVYQQSAPTADPYQKNPLKQDGSLNHPFYETDAGVVEPVKLEPWQEVLHPLQGDDRQNVVDTYAAGQLGQFSRNFPSESTGFTSDPRKARLAGGALNPAYTTLTAEDFRYSLGVALERFVNPVYGGWQGGQYPKTNESYSPISTASFSNLFTSSWVKANASKKPQEVLPLLADWQGNDYGMSGTLLQTGPRWMGKVTGTTVELTKDANSQITGGKVVATVRYTAWTESQSKVTKDGVITLDFVTNTTDLRRAKALLSQATLTLK